MHFNSNITKKTGTHTEIRLNLIEKFPYTKFRQENIIKCVIIRHPFLKESFRKGGSLMNNSDLIWRLVELILKKENDLNQVALDQAKKDITPNDQEQDEV